MNLLKKIHRLGLALMLLGAVSCNTVQEAKKPNIIYILADDLGYGDLSCLNPNSKIKTPTLDAFAKEGISFTNALTNASVCTPTRYGIMTGRYCWRGSLKSQVIEAHEPEVLEQDRKTVANMLQKQGYNTACIGKWHLGLNFAKIDSAKPLTEGKRWHIKSSANMDYSKPVTGGPTDHGFDYEYIIPGSLDMFPYCFIENGNILGDIERKPYGITKNKNRGLNYRDGDTAKDFKREETLEKITDKATQYIADMSKEDKPFFLYFPMTAPHTPWVPTKEFQGKSQAGYYGDFVVMVDAMINKVLQSIEDAEIRENTIVIITSDNGSDQSSSEMKQFNHQANYGRRGRKAGIYDGGFHVPFFVRWPGSIKAGITSNEEINTVDLYATLADVLNVEIDENTAEDSYSILPVWNGQKLKQPLREITILHSFWGKYAIRKGKWKYIDTKGDFLSTSKDGELYNIQTDSLETINQFENEPKIVAELQKMLDQYKKSGRSTNLNKNK